MALRRGVGGRNRLIYSHHPTVWITFDQKIGMVCMKIIHLMIDMNGMGSNEMGSNEMGSNEMLERRKNG